METMILIEVRDDGTLHLAELSKDGYKEVYAEGYKGGGNLWADREEVKIKDIVKRLESMVK